MGALVSQVIEGSPAEKHGIRAGDVILSFNGKPILDSSNLPPLVGRVSVGESAKVKLLRDGKQRTLDVVIEQLPEDDKPLASSGKPASSNRLGVDVSDLDKSEYQALGRGVRVQRVAPGSIAQQSGVRPGDVILQINRKNVENTADFRKKVANLPTGRMIPVLVHRQGADQFIVMKIPPED